MKKFRHRDLLVLLGICVLVTVVRFPSLEEPLDNDSGSIAYHAHWILQGEPLYGTHHPGHHLPGSYYTYALIFLLFGESSWVIKAVLIPFTVVTAYLVYRFGVRLRGFTTGVLAATLYALLASNVYLKGTTGATELFANLPRVAAIWLCVEFIERRITSPAFALVGALGASAFLYKAINLSPMFVPFILLAATAKVEGTWREFRCRVFWMMAGFGISILAVIGYFASHGLLGRLLYVFRLGMGYIEGLGIATSIIAMVVAPIVLFGSRNPLLLIVAIAAFAVVTRKIFGSEWRLLWRRQHPPDVSRDATEPRNTAELALVAWLVLSLVEAGIGHPGFPNYNLLLVPHLSLLAAWGLGRCCDIGSGIMKRGGAWVAATAAAIIIVMCLVANYPMYHQYYRYKRGTGDYASFLRSTFSGALFLEAKKLSDYVGARTAPDDYVYLWDDNMIFYNLVHRRAPIENQWSSYADAFGSYERIFGPRTKYVIVGRSALRERPPWLYEELRKRYHLETVIEGQEIYRFRK